MNAAILEQGKTVATNSDSCKKNKSVVDNNLKYLINLDRNIRRKNVVMFGIPENTTLNIGGEHTTDIDKRDALFDFMGCPDDLEITDCFRLGKPALDSDKPRPLKISFLTKGNAESVLLNAKKLNDLKNDGVNIYVKPDKTKSEQNEFQRLGKKKEELLLKYPTVDENNPRVTLKKGSLQVDGVEVDKYEPVQTLF